MKKRCNTCEVEKDFSEFYNRSRSPDGKQYACIRCQKEKTRQHQIDNPKYWRALEKKWRERNPESYKKVRKRIESQPHRKEKFRKFLESQGR